jgi:hypothetical protein
MADVMGILPSLRVHLEKAQLAEEMNFFYKHTSMPSASQLSATLWLLSGFPIGSRLDIKNKAGLLTIELWNI